MKKAILFQLLAIFSDVIDFYSTVFSIELDKRSFDEMIDAKHNVEYVTVRIIASDTTIFDFDELRNAFNEFLYFSNCPFDKKEHEKLCIYIPRLRPESKTTFWADILVLNDSYSWELYKKINMEGIKI